MSIEGSHGRFNQAFNVPADRLTIGQLSRETGLEIEALRRLMRAGKLHPIEFSPNGWNLFARDDVERVRALEYPTKQPGGRKPRPKPPQPQFPPTPGVQTAAERAPHLGSAPPIMHSPAPGAMLEERVPLGRYAYPTEVALAAMKLFREGKQILDAAFELGINPQLAARLAEDFARIDGALLFTQPMVAKLNKSNLDGTFPLKTAENVLELVDSAIEVLRCVKCGERARKYCRECARGVRREAREAAEAQSESDSEA